MVVNMYIYYLAIYNYQLYQGQRHEQLMTHLQFKKNCRALTMNWRGRVDDVVEELEVKPELDVPQWSQQQWKCV